MNSGTDLVTVKSHERCARARGGADRALAYIAGSEMASAARRLGAIAAAVVVSPSPVVSTDQRPPDAQGQPRLGSKSDGELSFERGLASFASKEAGWYDTVEKNGISLIYRAVEFSEFAAKIEDLDRSESRPAFYSETEDGELLLHEEPDELPDWDDERRSMHCGRVETAVLEHGGAIIGAFDLQPNGHQVLVGASVLDGTWFGKDSDTLDMYFLFVSRTLKQQHVDAGGTQRDFRSGGVGSELFQRCCMEAKARGAKKLYISAANGQRTIDFCASPAQSLTPPSALDRRACA